MFDTFQTPAHWYVHWSCLQYALIKTRRKGHGCKLSGIANARPSLTIYATVGCYLMSVTDPQVAIKTGKLRVMFN